MLATGDIGQTILKRQLLAECRYTSLSSLIKYVRSCGRDALRVWICGLCRQWRRNEFESGRHTPDAKRRKNFCCGPQFFALKVQLVVLLNAFVIVSTVLSVSCLLIAVLLLTVPPCPAICKIGGTCPRAIWSRRRCLQK